jgi:KDO2-lipid IV(A) lauroyltransferase
MNLIIAAFFRMFVIAFAAMPFRPIYLFSDFLAFVLQYLVRYRVQVVRSNLRKAIPGITGCAKRRLIRGIYRNLTDVLVESMKAFTLSADELSRRHFIVNPEVLEPFRLQGRSVIVVTGHYGNWEWGSFSPALQMKFQVVGFYKPMRNPYIDRYVRRSRERFGTYLASIRETTMTFEKFTGVPCIFLMAADQNPTKKHLAHRTEFLGIDTPFLHGPEKHCRQNDCVLAYADVRRIKRGYYQVEITVLTEHPGELPEGEPTRRFAKKLESVILENPANWLWTHKRWKSG